MKTNCSISRSVIARMRNEFIVILLNTKFNIPVDEIGEAKSKEYGFCFYHLLKYMKYKNAELHLRDLLKDDWDDAYSVFRDKYRNSPRKCRHILIEKMKSSNFKAEHFLAKALNK